MIDSYVRIFSLHMYAYVSASYDDCFVKIWATCENFLGKWFTAPPDKKLPVRLWLRSHFQVAFYLEVVVLTARYLILKEIS